MPRKIVLDTDIGSDVDDALCLALALASPEIEIVGLTTVGRESTRRARVARKLLDLAGRTEIPVFAGCRVPLLGGRSFNWFGHEASATLAPGEEPQIEAEHGVDAILRLSAEHADLEVVAVGPLTNVAVALAKDPDLAARVARLSIMGGHIRKAEYGGHVFAPGIDYNMCSDAHASYAVCRSGIRTQLVTADVTLQTWLTNADLAAIERVDTAFHRTLAHEIRAWTPLMKQIFAGMGCSTDDDVSSFLHDPLALACVYDDGFCEFEDLEIEPRIDERGVFRTLEQPEPSDATFPMRCALAVDAPAFRTHFLERVTKWLPVPSSDGG